MLRACAVCVPECHRCRDLLRSLIHSLARARRPGGRPTDPLGRESRSQCLGRLLTGSSPGSGCGPVSSRVPKCVRAPHPFAASPSCPPARQLRVSRTRLCSRSTLQPPLSRSSVLMARRREACARAPPPRCGTVCPARCTCAMCWARHPREYFGSFFRASILLIATLTTPAASVH